MELSIYSLTFIIYLNYNQNYICIMLSHVISKVLHMSVSDFKSRLQTI